MDVNRKQTKAIDSRASRLCFFRPLKIEPLEERTLLAAQLLADINTTLLGAPINGPITTVGNIGYFNGNDGIHGPELWRTDGTTAGTYLLKDVSSDFGSYPDHLTNVNGTLFFSAEGDTGYGLWKSDGTAGGTSPITGGNELYFPGGDGSFANVNGKLFFSATDHVHGVELWMSDGTAPGTAMVADIQPGSVGSGPSSLVNVNGMLFFLANDGTAGNELWKSDGTAAGTALVKDIRSGPADSGIQSITAVGSTLFFTANDGTSGYELWKSDGTAGGTQLVKDITPGITSYSGPKYLTNVAGTLYFSATSNGLDLWKSDGTSQGTKPVVEGVPASAKPSFPFALTNIGGALFFAATDLFVNFGEVDLWTSDGTSEGTTVVNGVYDPSMLTAVGSTLYFRAADSIGNHGLWKFDATHGTALVKQIDATAYFTNVGGKLFFESSRGLASSDGTDAGTGLVPSAMPTNASSGASGFATVGSVAYFAADDGVHGSELWKTDGTASGTVMVKDIDPGAASSGPAELTNVNGTLFFRADGYLCTSDGTEAGTACVSSALLNPSNSINVGGTLFFSSIGFTSGLWKSDGTAGGTIKLSGIYATMLTNVGGTLFFRGHDSTHGYELWKSDGTVPGTVLLREFQSGGAGASIANLINANGVLYFTANDGTHGTEVWKSDGTEQGTVLVKDLQTGSNGQYISSLGSVGGVVLFNGYDGTDSGLWRTDGTDSGTIAIKVDTPSGPMNVKSPAYFTTVNGAVYFRAYDPLTLREELWKSDGTSAGTLPLTAGTLLANIGNLRNVNGNLYFITRAFTDFGVLGNEVWQSNGTAAGTSIVRDIALGPANSVPFFGLPRSSNESFAAVGGHVVFGANDYVHGRELWITTSNTPPSFTKGADQIVDEDDGIVTIPGWATNISPGPPEESYQRVAFTVTWDNSELFNNVSIDPLGNLTIDLVPDAHGTAQLVVVLKDDGGTTEGGRDTSPAQTFRIQVNSVNDRPSFNMQSGDLVYPEDYGDVAIDQWTSFLSAGPANEVNQAVTFIVVNDNNGLFALQPTIDLAGKLTFRTADNANGSATITVVAKDDGGTANHGIDTSLLHTFTVTLTPVNDPPSFIKGDDQMVLEDSGGVIVRGWATEISPGPPDEILQPVFFSTQVSNPSLFDVLPTVHDDGTLTFTPAANTNGSSQVLVAAFDDGEPGTNFSAYQTFLITVKAVNDPPTFAAGADQTATDESGEQTVPGWATNVLAGPADESAQVLKFIVTTDDDQLFSVSPAIDADGQLTFTPKPNARGQAIVTVALMDDAGTADGGKDMSPPYTLLINIDKPHLWLNLLNQLDVNGDTHVAPNDAVAVINYVNAFGMLNSGKVPAVGTPIGSGTADSGQPFGFVDANGDNFVAPNDALAVINGINAGQGGEGEADGSRGSGVGSRGSEVGGRESDFDQIFALLAGDMAGQPLPRRRDSVK